MSVNIHDYILATHKDEHEVKFESSGKCTASGIPVGKITFIYRRICTGTAVKKYVSAYVPSGTVNIADATMVANSTNFVRPGDIVIGPPVAPATPADGGGGWELDNFGNLVISIAGATARVTIPKIGGAYEFKEECTGIADLILGYYTFAGTWTSTHKNVVWGGWAG